MVSYENVQAGNDNPSSILFLNPLPTIHTTLKPRPASSCPSEYHSDLAHESSRTSQCLIRSPSYPSHLELLHLRRLVHDTEWGRPPLPVPTRSPTHLDARVWWVRGEGEGDERFLLGV